MNIGWAIAALLHGLLYVVCSTFPVSERTEGKNEHLIKDIEIPKSCNDCEFIQRGYPDWCDLSCRSRDVFNSSIRPDWCPLEEAEPKWIPIEQDCPKRGKDVLISHNGVVSIDWLTQTAGVGYFFVSGVAVQDIDAWMPLPEPFVEVEE